MAASDNFSNEVVGESVPSTSTLVDAGGDEHFKMDKHGRVKYPRQLIHCSDGILEEYSTDEEEEEEPSPPIDTSKLTWGPYLWHYTVKTAFGGLAVCDYLGEKLAYVFGITTPKYQYAISEFERMQEEEEEERKLEEEERAAEEKIIIEAKSHVNPCLQMDDVVLEENKNVNESAATQITPL